ncbi:hypothetical protein [uncultured Cohaesibacter sp.]|uniref:hypothetical protein n=1 Tax=uncultured Cohaesibacter sp. TaxID=1002546 RepID=UPI002AAC4D0F|nr:hypothetical protein [uncultured Cohaesibacter sp.]
MQIASELGKNGYYIQVGEKVPSNFTVLGERSSGTNFLKAQLDTIPDMQFKNWGWKHAFITAWNVSPNLMIFGIVRNWNDWLLSMHKKPWHASKQLHEMAFSDFIRTKWESHPIPRPRQDQNMIIEKTIPGDRNPIDGSQIENVLALRALKLKNLLSLPLRAENVVLMKYEWFNQNPGALSDLLKSKFPSLDCPNFEKIKGKSFASFENYKRFEDFRPEFSKTIPEEDLSFIKSNLDSELEASLGYM